MPKNEAPNAAKRTITLSAPADPRTDQRRKASKEESDKVRRALGELRQRNSELNANIHSLEMTIGEPAFRRLFERATSSSADSSLVPSSAEPSSSSDDLKRQKIAQCKKILGAKLAKFAGKGQKLYFGVLNVHHCHPKFFVAINSENCKLVAVSIVGPPDIKKRSSGALRVADEVLSLDRSLISDLINEDDEQQQRKNSSKKNSPRPSCNHKNQSQKCSSAQAAAERARNRVERALERAAAEQQQPPLVVFGVLRRDAKIMAVNAQI
ncbi:hypothetical protein niasHS_001465 [Heterodera schachtii]|uniref:Uncharacterized protein n=1 Tax=Heterodera schachtii TaxID=97005 RepID=A0ABD2KEC2_HETSC